MEKEANKSGDSRSDTESFTLPPLSKRQKVIESVKKDEDKPDCTISKEKLATETDSTQSMSDYLSISSLRNLVASEYSEEVFQLMVVAGQIPCTTRTIPTFDQFKSNLLNDRAFADEHSIGIISSKFSIAFLILDDNIGGKPTIYWYPGDASKTTCTNEESTALSRPKHFMILRLGRQHYSGIRFNSKLLQDSSHLHPQIADFWAEQLKTI